MNMLTRKLIACELHRHRWMIAASIVAGLGGLAVVAHGGSIAFNVGFLVWLTTIVAFGVVAAMFSIATERKERVMNWVLTLPISHGDYVRIKVVALLLCFVVVWFVLGVAALGLVVVLPDLPDGLLPFAVLLVVFLLGNYSFVVCSALHSHSEGMMTVAVVVHNIAISLFMFAVAAIGDISRYMQGAVPVWNSAFWTVLVIELAVFLILFSLPFFVAARRRDFI
jgi:ABC-type transport system involved in multi-copper enzyme maturation permease subunit